MGVAYYFRLFKTLNARSPSFVRASGATLLEGTVFISLNHPEGEIHRWWYFSRRKGSGLVKPQGLTSGSFSLVVPRESFSSRLILVPFPAQVLRASCFREFYCIPMVVTVSAVSGPSIA